MMNDEEIAWALLQLLRDTRHYRGCTFACERLNSAERRKYAVGLWSALPEPERVVVCASFNKIYHAVAAVRTANARATHQAPRATQ